MKHFMGSAALALCALTPLIAQEIEYYDGRPAVAGELLVKFRESRGGSQKLRGDSVRMRRYQIREAQDLGQSGYTHLRLASRQARQMLLDLAQDPEVEYVEPNYIVSAGAVPNDPRFSTQWGLKNTVLAGADIDATTAWETTTGSRTAVIGVVDTGVDYTHPDLKDNMWSAPKEFTVTFGPGDTLTCPAGSRGYHAVTNSCDPKDAASHGTLVSGVIAASGNNGVGVSGVNWTASVMGLGFMNAQGQGSVAGAIRAIEFAIQAKKALGSAANVKVLNNSWGGSGFSQALLDQILKAQDAGMLFVAAAGNSPVDLDQSPSYPAGYTTAPNLIAVAATDNQDRIATFSSYGVKTVHLGAPGVAIASTIPGNSYGSASGTSFASPMTAGVAGLVLAACPQLDTASLRKVILENTEPIPALNGKTSTGGRLSAFKSVRACGQVASSFTLTAAPATSFTVYPGGTANAAIQVVATGGFKDPVTLTAAGLPAGVTGVFSPATATPGTAVVLKLTAAANAATTATSAAVSIRGVSGTRNATASIQVSVKNPFSLTVPLVSNLSPGFFVTVPVAVTGFAGFTSPVALTVTGLPAGVTGVFIPASAVPGATASLRLSAAATAAFTTADVEASVKGTSGTLSFTAPLKVGVKPPFTLTTNPPSAALAPGTSLNFTVQLASSTGFTGLVVLTATGLPPGVTANFTPASAAPGTPISLRLITAGTAAPTSTESVVQLRGVSGSFNATGSIKVAVRPPFQVIPNGNSVTLTPGSSANVNLTIAATAGFNSPVALTVTGLPTGVTGLFNPPTAAPGTPVTLKLTAASTAPATTTAATVASIIRGTSGALSVQTPLSVGVSTASFELTATPAALTVNRGETATFNFGITTTGSFAQPIGLEFAGLPATATGSTSSSGAGKFALKIVTKPTTTAQTYDITLTGTSGALRKATTVKLTVK